MNTSDLEGSWFVKFLNVKKGQTIIRLDKAYIAYIH